ncbi:MAG: RNA polymerase sigma factor RpoE [Gammaproteobacteria bacterium]|nr:RNA polymerase sigma factor RpoE [Gammaproteobacteria bacterium]MBL6998907.1 RNA polymerase sigma factor RpoE [Gammaproteobacteria bacterium]
MGSVDLDSELVKRVQNGDKAAFDVLVKKYQQKVVNLVSRFVSDHSECYDVAQDTFIKAYRAMDNFRGDSQFYTWLYRIAANTAKNHLATRSRKTPTYSVDVEDAEHYEGENGLKDQTTPENLLLTEEIKRTVYAAIEKLPEDLKTAITLRELEGLSYDEIADVMDCPIGTVRSRIFRARDAIDKELRPLLE